MFYCFYCSGKWDYFPNFFSSDLSQLWYRNAIDFCVFILYSATLPNSSMSSSSYQVASSEFSMNILCHLQIVTLLLFLIQFTCLISFSSLISVDSKTVLNKIVPDLRGNALSFSQLTMVLVVSLSHMALC